MVANDPTIPGGQPNSGLYRRVSNAVRSQIPRATNVLYRTPNDSTTRVGRSRSSSTSSGSTEEIERTTRPTTPQSDSPRPSNGSPAPLTLQRATQRPRPLSINIDAAEVGYNLCASARRHAQSQAPDEVLLRTMHIDAVYYLSRALPQDLTTVEAARLREATPRAVYNSSLTRRPTALRRFTARSTAYLFGWIFLIVPLLVAVLNSILVYERQHHLSERGLLYVQETYVSLAGRLAGSADDPASRGNALGRLLATLMLWVVDVVSEIMTGAGEGFGEAIPSGQGQVTDDQADQRLRR